MADLRSGVLLKLLQGMCIDNDKESNDVRKPVLLQIRSIIPVLAEGDLWPNQGFFLKVSDSSHAMYVSLPQEQDDMVLCNKLQLGQFIYVEKLEPAYPVPMLKDIKPVFGRRPCLGDPKDLVSLDNLEKFCGASQLKMITEEKFNNDDLYNHGHDYAEKTRHRERFRLVSSSRAGFSGRKGRRGSSCSRRGDGERECWIRSRGGSYGDKDSDCESSLSVLSCGSAASSGSRRKSWNGDFSDSAVIKHEIKPIGRSSSGSVCISSSHHSRNDSSDDNSTSRPRRKDVGLATKSARSDNKSRTSSLRKKDVESLPPEMKLEALNDKKWMEAEISWDSLPLNLIKLGKEVLRQRNMALLAAVEALQEASASERLLKCLSTFSELQSFNGDDQLLTVDRFFNLHKDLSQTRVILQSLRNITSLRSTETGQDDTFCVKEQLKLGLERKKNATSWIKAALASDLNPICSPFPNKSKRVSLSPDFTEKKSSRTTTHGGKTKKGTYIIKMHRSNSETKDKQIESWTRGSAWTAGAELANTLQDESRTWFLGYVENYLDGVDLESISRQSDGEVAKMMCKIKRMNDWLDLVVAKREVGSKETCITLKDSELEAYGRLRNKIYRILLKNVERTALAFGRMNLMVEED